MLAPGFLDRAQIERRRIAAGGFGLRRMLRRLQRLTQGFTLGVIEGLRALLLNIQYIFQRPEQPVKTVTTMT